MNRLRRRVMRNNVFNWAERFLQTLDSCLVSHEATAAISPLNRNVPKELHYSASKTSRSGNPKTDNRRASNTAASPTQSDLPGQIMESDTTLDNVFATGRIRNRWVMSARPHLVLAGLLPTRHALGGHYSNVGTRLVLHPDPRSSRIGSGRGTRADGMSPTSSRNRVPFCAISKRPIFCIRAPVKAPFS